MELTNTSSFSVVAERFRRAGQPEKAVTLCREGLERFPDHLSARVTLGWSLLDMGEYQEAFDQLKIVLKRAPDNLAAIRGLAELHERGIGLVFEPLSDSEPEEFGGEIDPVMPVPQEIPQPYETPQPYQTAASDMDLDPVMPALAELPETRAESAEAFEDVDPFVEAEVPLFAMPTIEASRFEIENLIDAVEPDSMFDLSGLDADQPAPSIIERKPVSAFDRAPLALRDEMGDECAGELDEWLSRVRNRRAGSVSQYMAS